MACHKSNFGQFGANLPADIHGYVPDAETGPWELEYDHGTECTHTEEGELTEYGEWWVDVRYPEIQQAAIKATQEAESAIDRWRRC